MAGHRTDGSPVLRRPVRRNSPRSDPWAAAPERPRRGGDAYRDRGHRGPALARTQTTFADNTGLGSVTDPSRRSWAVRAPIRTLRDRMSPAMHGILLGSGGGIQTQSRCTCSALFRCEDKGLLVDAGTGVSHLVTQPPLLEGVNELAVVLTHFHLDHLVGLSYLPSLSPRRPISIYGPGQTALCAIDRRAPPLGS